jgi:hypothetical protein
MTLRSFTSSEAVVGRVADEADLETRRERLGQCEGERQQRKPEGAPQRSSLRITSFNPDHTFVHGAHLHVDEAHRSATSRTVSSVMSVGTFEAFFGQDTQMVASGRMAFRVARQGRGQLCARLGEEMDHIDRLRHLLFEGDAFGKRLQRVGIGLRRSETKTCDPGLMPSFFASGVPEYPTVTMEAILSKVLIPELLQPLGRNRQRRAQLLGEERDPQLFDQPAVILEMRVSLARIEVGLRARFVALPQRLHRVRVLLVALGAGAVLLQPERVTLDVARQVLQAAPTACARGSPGR